ncbi:hypothetical protein MYK68_15835 [Gordonia sp. PP30]|uniref:glycine-rich domain-containing protein n=1 Tax=Gordonia sp. PP30 TaxID=2935861 RepID=UPI001FFFAE04|nr:hypothetical protein [Gordonia sp. PP30]UQE77180.1 hypothetical protein MYK68_15835 [Gordonia sp. PP30]
MTWTDIEPAPRHPRGWIDPATPIEPPAPVLGWVPVEHRRIVETMLARDTAAVRARPRVVDRALARDTTTVVLADPLRVVERAVSADRCVALPRLRGEQRALTQDRGRVGLHPAEILVAADRGAARLGVMAPRVQALAADRGIARPRLAGTTITVARDSGTGGFTSQAAVLVPVTASSTIAIPVWCRWIDVVCLGAGGGGAAGAQGFPGGDGNGGPAGGWAAVRWDRGAGRNLWHQLQVTIGAGGSGGPQPGGAGGAGGSTIVQARTPAGAVSGVALSGAGGAGGSGQSIGGGVSGAQTGKAPGNYSFQGITASGGGENGGTPGGGGRGGGGSFWPATPGSGSTGARGQAWLMFSM